MTPDELRDEARFLEGLALRYRASWTGDFHRGKSEAFRQSARFLRRAAAREEGYEVSVLRRGPRGLNAP
jgi:hypothetical protein